MSDSRAYVEELMAIHQPCDDREAHSLEKFRQIVPTLPDLFTRDNREHVTASAVIVGRRGTILHKHKSLKKWIQPGGHIEADEFPYDAAIREALEETGLVVSHPHDRPTFIHFDVHHAANDHIHLDLRYLAIAEDLDPNPPPNESQDVKWFSFHEAIPLTDPAGKSALLIAEECWRDGLS